MFLGHGLAVAALADLHPQFAPMPLPPQRMGMSSLVYRPPPPQPLPFLDQSRRYLVAPFLHDSADTVEDTPPPPCRGHKNLPPGRTAARRKKNKAARQARKRQRRP